MASKPSPRFVDACKQAADTLSTYGYRLVGSGVTRPRAVIAGHAFQFVLHEYFPDPGIAQVIVQRAGTVNSNVGVYFHIMWETMIDLGYARHDIQETLPPSFSAEGSPEAHSGQARLIIAKLRCFAALYELHAEQVFKAASADAALIRPDAWFIEFGL